MLGEDPRSECRETASHFYIHKPHFTSKGGVSSPTLSSSGLHFNTKLTHLDLLLHHLSGTATTMAPNSSNTTITTTSLDEDMAELGPQSSRRSFRDFPAEVRNKIYFYALIDDYVTGIIRRSGTIRSQPHVDWPSFYGKASSELGARINTSLLRVSTTISQEATPILYGNHVFLIRNPNHFLDWVKMIGIKNAACVRMLRLEYTSICRGMFLEVLPSCKYLH